MLSSACTLTNLFTVATETSCERWVSWKTLMILELQTSLEVLQQ